MLHYQKIGIFVPKFLVVSCFIFMLYRNIGTIPLNFESNT
nr:hypothetical protein FICFSXYB_FICFSXYB_CDS_0003 [Microvirus sp.]